MAMLSANSDSIPNSSNFRLSFGKAPKSLAVVIMALVKPEETLVIELLYTLRKVQNDCLLLIQKA